MSGSLLARIRALRLVHGLFLAICLPLASGNGGPLLVGHLLAAMDHSCSCPLSEQAHECTCRLCLLARTHTRKTSKSASSPVSSKVAEAASDASNARFFRKAVAEPSHVLISGVLSQIQSKQAAGLPGRHLEDAVALVFGEGAAASSEASVALFFGDDLILSAEDSVALPFGDAPALYFGDAAVLAFGDVGTHDFGDALFFPFEDVEALFLEDAETQSVADAGALYFGDSGALFFGDTGALFFEDAVTPSDADAAARFFKDAGVLLFGDAEALYFGGAVSLSVEDVAALSFAAPVTLSAEDAATIAFGNAQALSFENAAALPFEEPFARHSERTVSPYSRDRVPLESGVSSASSSALYPAQAGTRSAAGGDQKRGSATKQSASKNQTQRHAGCHKAEREGTQGDAALVSAKTSRNSGPHPLSADPLDPEQVEEPSNISAPQERGQLLRAFPCSATFGDGLLLQLPLITLSTPEESTFIPVTELPPPSYAFQLVEHFPATPTPPPQKAFCRKALHRSCGLLHPKMKSA